MSGQATNAQIASFLTAMRMKGESIDEITACAMVMREHGLKLPHEGDVLEIVGTGGDEAFTFNISTVSAFVISAAGVPVAKHGNRSVSSRCGAADLLEALGARLDLTAEQSAQVLRSTGMCFLFAPVYHASMKYAARCVRRWARVLFSIFWVLWLIRRGQPPAAGGIRRRIGGAHGPGAEQSCVKRAMVVHGHDGLDEATLCTSTTVCEIEDGQLNRYILDPVQLGFTTCFYRRIWWAADRKKMPTSPAVSWREKRGLSGISCCSTRRCACTWPITGVLAGVRPDCGGDVGQRPGREQMERFVRLTQEAGAAQ